ncbi:FAD-binding oxidoreductase [bacterium]|nr:MAG: FAD-binding oxidoreductase [bacterium]
MNVMERLCPSSYDEASRMLHEASTGGNTAIVGSGSRDAWFPPARSPVVALDSAALSGIVRYTPADLTICVRAGTPLADVQAALGREGQRLPLDPWPQGTVGGLIASNDNGPLRTRWGGVRDALIGVRVALPNGEVARFGGDVVKNVAGYDLTKGYVGSAGAFGMIVEATFKVQPQPARGTSTALSGTLDAVAAAWRALRERALPFAAIEVVRTEDGWTLYALAEGDGVIVERLIRECGEAARNAGCSTREAGHDEVVEQARKPAGARTWLRVGVPPAQTASVLASLAPDQRAVARPWVGIVEIFGEALGEDGLMPVLRGAVEARGHAHVRRADDGLRRLLGWWRIEQIEGGRTMFPMLKNALDPARRCNAGRTIYDQLDEG